MSISLFLSSYARFSLDEFRLVFCVPCIKPHFCRGCISPCHICLKCSENYSFVDLCILFASTESLFRVFFSTLDEHNGRSKELQKSTGHRSIFFFFSWYVNMRIMRVDWGKKTWINHITRLRVSSCVYAAVIYHTWSINSTISFRRIPAFSFSIVQIRVKCIDWRDDR